MRLDSIWLKTILLLAAIMLVLGEVSYVQASSITFIPPGFIEVLLGGSGNDYVWRARVFPNGSMVLAVTTQSFGVPYSTQYDGGLWVAYLDPTGMPLRQWVYNYSSPLTIYDEELLSDGSVVLVGATSSWKAIIGRILSNGTVSFFKRVSPVPTEYFSYLTSVTVSPDGYILAGGSYYDLSTRNFYTWIIKMRGDGSIVWSKAFNIPPYSPLIMSLKFVNETTVVAAGFHAYYRAWIGALDYSTGELKWSFWAGTSPNDRFYRLSVIPGGMIAVAGRTGTSGLGGTDALLALFRHSDGSLVWSKAIGTPNNDEGWDTAYTGDGIILVGYAPVEPAEYKNDTIIAKYSLDGTLAWYKIYGGHGRDWAYSAYVDSHGYIYVFGGFEVEPGNTDALILKTNERGEILGCSYTRYGTLSSASPSLPMSPASSTPSDITPYTTTASLPLSSKPVTEAGHTMLCRAYVGGKLLTRPTDNAISLTIAALLIIPAATMLAVLGTKKRF